MSATGLVEEKLPTNREIRYNFRIIFEIILVLQKYILYDC